MILKDEKIEVKENKLESRVKLNLNINNSSGRGFQM